VCTRGLGQFTLLCCFTKGLVGLLCSSSGCARLYCWQCRVADQHDAVKYIASEHVPHYLPLHARQKRGRIQKQYVHH
jgi:hypothetical protein